MDQQCTVTRPGIAPTTASYATELYTTVLQHPLGANAPAPSVDDEDLPFGVCVHQIRGHMSNWEQDCLTGLASPYCVGCGDSVLREWKRRGEEFVKKVCERGGGRELERVSGLEEVKKDFERGWDGGDDEEGEWEL